MIKSFVFMFCVLAISLLFYFFGSFEGLIVDVGLPGGGFAPTSPTRINWIFFATSATLLGFNTSIGFLLGHSGIWKMKKAPCFLLLLFLGLVSSFILILLDLKNFRALWAENPIGFAIISLISGLIFLLNGAAGYFFGLAR
jgi:hypothetical protein